MIPSQAPSPERRNGLIRGYLVESKQFGNVTVYQPQYVIPGKHAKQMFQVLEKTIFLHKVVSLQMLDFETSILNLRSQNQIGGNYFLLKNHITSERAVFHSVLYYQQLSPLLVTK